MANYMLLIYDDEKLWQRFDEDERNEIMREYFAYTNELREAGVYVDAAPLQPTRTARTVRIRDGEDQVTDGPFAETKEQLGGYYVIDVESTHEAERWARKIPSARFGSIEVRPVMPVPEHVPSEAGA
jgi:hypothetical protein